MLILLYNSSPREKKKERKETMTRWRQWSLDQIHYVHYFMLREAKVYVKLTVHTLHGLIAECVRGKDEMARYQVVKRQFVKVLS